MTYSHHSVWPLTFSTYTRFTEACYPRQDSEFYSWSLSQELAQIAQKEMASFPLVRV